MTTRFARSKRASRPFGLYLLHAEHRPRDLSPCSAHVDFPIFTLLRTIRIIVDSYARSVDFPHPRGTQTLFPTVSLVRTPMSGRIPPLTTQRWLINTSASYPYRFPCLILEASGHKFVSRHNKVFCIIFGRRAVKILSNPIFAFFVIT